ncbi:HepT-like ribonuclease domain-containing protein [Roseiflexus sp.]|jgi:uncharacterized protein with HEPN domain|uniref:HepT-like ribonuclease domain-containing protein n=1 Tax=Roseiflexus sp. TaxID=2562120 RepID=UPI0025FF79A9|nr:HepT-like ribonuclease domain-containing protein [Roseiflexus sp.]MCL6542945.1 DUF86 domain-containing protein [Roseiflexus sp.]
MWRDEATLLDIAQAARRIVSFVRGVDEASFAANAEKHWAVVAQLLIIGEAVTRLSNEFRSSHPEIAWAKIAGMRNRLIHGYDSLGPGVADCNGSRAAIAEADRTAASDGGTVMLPW